VLYAVVFRIPSPAPAPRAAPLTLADEQR